MNYLFRGFNAILYKEFIVVLRDPFTLFFMFFPPMLEMVAFGFALDTDVRHMSMVVYDQDRTVESRQLIQRFVNTETFRVVGEVQSAEAMSAQIRRGKAFVGIQVPPDYTRNLRAGRNAQVQVLIDGSSSNVALSALNTAMGVTFRESILRLLGMSGATALPVEVRPQILYNPSMRSPNFFLPGVIGVVLQIATTFITAMSLVRERERGTLEQLFVSPLSRSGLMLGKLVPYMIIGSAMAIFLFALMRFLFHVAIAGSMIALMVSSFAYVFSLLTLGLLISTRAQNQIQALQMCMVFIMPSVFFSGFIFPRETMPFVFWALGAMLPTTYFIELARAIILRGAYLSEFWEHLAILTSMGMALFLICAWRFKTKIS